MEPKREYSIDPWYSWESEGIAPSAQRLGEVIDCLNRDDIPDLSPLATFVLERTISKYLRLGFIGSPVELHTDLMQANPPERMYIDRVSERENSVGRILQSLERKGFLVLDPKTETYSLGTQPPNQPE